MSAYNMNLHEHTVANRFNNTHYSIYTLIIQVYSSFQIFPPEYRIHISPPRCPLPHLLLLDSIALMISGDNNSKKPNTISADDSGWICALIVETTKSATFRD
jgi:hypothetical protein